MAYKALYREYRPRQFSDIKGQDGVARVLKSQAAQGRFSHTYLFTGPRGTGKTSAARILAMAANCEFLEEGEPCLKCENCRAALLDSSMDILEIDAASNNSVDNARALKNQAVLMPVAGKYRVYIIDEVHMLSSAAFNALLKLLEEPPSYAIFILATTEIRKLPATVLSRCQRFDFRRIEKGTIIKRMEEVAKKEGIEYEKGAFDIIARAADGGLRDALSLLDKCSAQEKVTLEGTRRLLGLADLGKMEALIEGILEFDSKKALHNLDAILEDGAEPATLVLEIMQELRDMLEGSFENGSTLKLVSAIEILGKAENTMRYIGRPSIILEAAVMRILLPEAGKDSSLSVEKLKNGLSKLSERLDKENIFPTGTLEDIFRGTGVEIID